MILEDPKWEKWWEELDAEIKAEGAGAKLIPPPLTPITHSEWCGDDDGIFNNHQFVSDSEMREY